VADPRDRPGPVRQKTPVEPISEDEYYKGIDDVIERIAPGRL
jgi:hypothetical protein